MTNELKNNELEIREKVKEFFTQKYNGIIIDEFTGGSMTTRSDVTCISKEHIIMAEIKGNKDSLTRLQNQVQDYSRYSNRVYVILDEIHRKKFEKISLRGANITVAFYKDGEFDRDLSDKSYYNYTPHNHHLSELLWAEESRELLYPLGTPPKNINSGWAVDYCYTGHELAYLSFAIIRDRWERLAAQGVRFFKGFQGGRLTLEIPHIEHKQKLLREFIEKLSENKDKHAPVYFIYGGVPDDYAYYDKTKNVVVQS